MAPVDEEFTSAVNLVRILQVKKMSSLFVCLFHTRYLDHTWFVPVLIRVVLLASIIGKYDFSDLEIQIKVSN